jgi:hypothetical protein
VTVTVAAEEEIENNYELPLLDTILNSTPLGSWIRGDGVSWTLCLTKGWLVSSAD